MHQQVDPGPNLAGRTRRSCSPGIKRSEELLTMFPHHDRTTGGRSSGPLIGWADIPGQRGGRNVALYTELWTFFLALSTLFAPLA
jgi:hypothetical protein